jgi:PAS domain S-box-containing protein
MDTRPMTILLIEDNPGDARLMREVFAGIANSPFELEHMDRLASGLARLTAGGIDVVLLDLSLPDSQGLDTLVRVQAHAPDVPIVVLTGLDDEALAVQALQQGAQDYLGKGYVQENRKVLTRSLRYAIARKRVEEQLREANQTRRALLQASPLPIIAIDLETTVTLWNPAAERAFGWAEAEVLGRPVPIVPPEKQEEFRRLRELVFQGKELMGVEVRCQKKDGSPIDISLSAAPLRDARGRVIGAIGIVVDITEHKRAEQELARLASFPEQSPNPIIETDEEGVVTYFNPAARVEFPDLMTGATHPILEGLKSAAITLRREQKRALAREITSGKKIFEQHLSSVPGSHLVRSYLVDITERQ